MPKLKKYYLYWTAEITGMQEVRAFDEDDARSQFISRQHIGEEDEPIEAELTSVVLIKEKTK